MDPNKPSPSRPATPVKPVRARPRKSRLERREDATAKILDAAEKLLARHGREGVTVRAVAKESGFDSALVHYYFDDLDGVFRAVFQRKSAIINAIRDKAMDEYMAAQGDKLTVEGAFDVFVRPVLQTMANDPKYWSNYAAIVSHTVMVRREYTLSSRSGGRQLMREAFDLSVSRFIDMLKKLAPETPAEEIYWFYHHVAGSLALTLAQTGRIDTLSGGLCQSSDMMAILDSTVRVFSAGFEAVRARHKPLRSSKKRQVKIAQRED